MGADRASVSGLVLTQALKLTGAGIVLGLPIALWWKPLLASFLYGVSPLDAATFVAIPMVLALVAFLASYLPARRAAKVDPMIALRYE